MSSMSTFREQQDRVLDLIGKSDSTTRNRIKNWLNMGYQDFVLREIWPFREATDTIATVAGTQEYTLVSEFADIDQNNIVSVAIQGANQRKLSYWPFNQLRASAPDPAFVPTEANPTAPQIPNPVSKEQNFKKWIKAKAANMRTEQANRRALAAVVTEGDA